MRKGMTDAQAGYRLLVAKLRRIARLEETLKLLEWDQATYMPAGAQQHRAEQMGVLAEVLHRYRTNPRFLALVDELAEQLGELEPAAAVDVRETKWRTDRLRKVPADLQAARVRAQALARAAWLEAREHNSFEGLCPHLREVVLREREYAQSVAPDSNIYQALLEDYEPGLPLEYIEQIFCELRKPLAQIACSVNELSKTRRKQTTVLRGHFPIHDQRNLSYFVAQQIGFDFRHGRIDESVHPFSISIGTDHRITTRYEETDLRTGLYSTLHELGHALYEQGLDADAHGLPRGMPCSLGVHESQSRLWENFIGRSEGFWRFLLPHASRFLPSLSGVALEAVLIDVNEAAPTPIRTEADELTYNLHVLLRYELERKLVNLELRVEELPEAWRHGMEQLLGVTPTSDREGVLQDIHWPSGAFGYFPTYTLGNVFAAQIMETAEREIGPLLPQISQGRFSFLLDWLTVQIYRRGQSYRSLALIQRVTGAPPSSRALLDHLHRRFDWWMEHGAL